MTLVSRHRFARPLLAAGIVIAVFLSSAPSAQEAYLHLNPVIEKLEQGRHVFGVSTADLSLQNARSLAGDPRIDYVYVRHGAQPAAVRAARAVRGVPDRRRQGRHRRARQRADAPAGVRALSRPTAASRRSGSSSTRSTSA